MARAKPVYGLDATAETRYSLPALFSARIAELWSWAPHIHDPANVSELHDMRIAAKRLRYCFEFFASLFGSGFKPTLDTFKKLQDFLGEIHDCDVWVDYLRSELDEAYAGFEKSRRRLRKHVGASRGLLQDAMKMRELLDGGPVSGLLLMLTEVAERRGRLFDELQVFWNELEARDFRSELLQAVSRATLARPPQAPAASVNGADSKGAPEADSDDSSMLLHSSAELGHNGGGQRPDNAAAEPAAALDDANTGPVS